MHLYHMNIKKRLKIAERVSLGSFFCGLVATGLTQQVVFTLAPLSLTLSLGLFRRDELEKKVQISQADIDDLPHLHQVQQLESKVEKLATTQLNSKSEDSAFQATVERIEQILSSIESKSTLPTSQEITLLKGRSESRKVFLKALEEANERLILVCPWVLEYAIDSNVKILIKKALDRGVKIDIGWGHLQDLKGDRDKIWVSDLLNNSLYEGVPWLLTLTNNNPNIELKILGTHEKYLICDRSYAMIGSHNFMTSSTNAKQQSRELGILTDNIETINNLVEMYDRSKSLSQYPLKYRTKHPAMSR
jgi:phosphatidylserine/phosphatidylglycerophosphate/cardiolipin synthase-like enzyme